MSLSDNSILILNQLYPPIKPLGIAIAEDLEKSTGRAIHIVQGLRSMKAQMALYMKGRATIQGKTQIVNRGQIVTNARPGLSFHCYGLAFDIAWAGEDPYLEKETKETQQDLWNEYGRIVMANNMHWGGSFKLSNGAHDLPHAEQSYGLSISECFELYDQGGIQMIWKHIDAIEGRS